MPLSTAPSPSACLCRIAEGDRSAWEALILHESGRLYPVAMTVLGDATAAEDILQEVWLQVRRHAHRFRPQPDAEAGDDAGARRWLRRLTINCAINWRRGDRRRQQRNRSATAGAGSAQATPLDQLAAREQQAALWSVLAELKPADRELVLMHYWQGLDHTALAGELGCQPATARKRLSRALGRLRRLVGRHPGLQFGMVVALLAAPDLSAAPTADLSARLVAGLDGGGLGTSLPSHLLFGGISPMTYLGLTAAAVLLTTSIGIGVATADGGADTASAPAPVVEPTPGPALVQGDPSAAPDPDADPNNISLEERLGQKITLSLKDVGPVEACAFISKQAGVAIWCSPQVADMAITLELEDVEVLAALQLIAKQVGKEVRIVKDKVFIADDKDGA